MVVKRAIKEGLIRNLLSGMTVQTNDGDDDASDEDGDDDPKSRIDLKTAKALINALAGWAGKGKDEIIQVLCREIGIAVAAVLKEPLNQVLENRKLRVSLELVPKTEAKPTAKKTPKTKQKTSSKKPPQQP